MVSPAMSSPSRKITTWAFCDSSSMTRHSRGKAARSQAIPLILTAPLSARPLSLPLTGHVTAESASADAATNSIAAEAKTPRRLLLSLDEHQLTATITLRRICGPGDHAAAFGGEQCPNAGAVTEGVEDEEGVAAAQLTRRNRAPVIEAGISELAREAAAVTLGNVGCSLIAPARTI